MDEIVSCLIFQCWPLKQAASKENSKFFECFMLLIDYKNIQKFAEPEQFELGRKSDSFSFSYVIMWFAFLCKKKVFEALFLPFITVQMILYE